MEPRWTWTDRKDRINKRDHRLSFDTARLVFDDPLAASRPDPHPDGDRWQTLGLVGSVILFVVHTAPEPDATTGQEHGRIISARKATAHERKAYEEGNF
ncbi:MAG TPA: BrnT family toxin [Acetobacteraceae bacterium]|nr:BrnT family toxin [Acetobacteraceae bacterium]